MDENDLKTIIENDINHPNDCYYFVSGFRVGNPSFCYGMKQLFSQVQVENLIQSHPEFKFSELNIDKSEWYFDPLHPTGQRVVVRDGKFIPEDYFIEERERNYQETTSKWLYEKGIDEKMQSADFSPIQSLRIAFNPLALKKDDSKESQIARLMELLKTKNFGIRGSGEFDVAVLIEIPKDEIDKIKQEDYKIHIPKEYIKTSYNVSRDLDKNQEVIGRFDNPNYLRVTERERVVSAVGGDGSTSGFRANSFERDLPPEVRSILDELMPKSIENPDINMSDFSFKKEAEISSVDSQNKKTVFLTNVIGYHSEKTASFSARLNADNYIERIIQKERESKANQK